ncbi:phage tail family protein [Bacillus subtilis]
MSDLLIDQGDGDQSLKKLLPFVRLQSFTPESPSIVRTTIDLPNRNGLVLRQRRVKYKERKIKAVFLIKAESPEHFYLYRSALSKLFVQDIPYYVTHSFSPGVRWKVVCDDSFDREKDRHKNYKEIEVEFLALDGLAESKFTTETPLNIEGEHFFPGMNIPDQNEIPYHFKDTADFKVYNASDVTIYPTEHDYTVEMYLAGTNITIANRTTAESFTIKGTLNSKQKVEIRRIYTLINNTAGVKTSGRFPSLAPGFNSFYVQNASAVDIQFKTRFYYKE